MKLGMLIVLLAEEPQENRVLYDFCDFFPTTFDSYRGYYDQLALGHSTYSLHVEPKTVAELQKDARACLGRTFMGWKGGEFIMDKDTNVWADNCGIASSTDIVAVRDTGYGDTLLITVTERC